MQCTVITPQKAVATFQKVAYVDIPGEAGRFGVKPGHSPLIATLKADETLIVREENGQEHTFTVGTGFVDVATDSVQILTQTVTEA